MAYDISLKLPQGWVSDLDSYIDESGVEITHLSCHLAVNLPHSAPRGVSPYRIAAFLPCNKSNATAH